MRTRKTCYLADLDRHLEQSQLTINEIMITFSEFLHNSSVKMTMTMVFTLMQGYISDIFAPLQFQLILSRLRSHILSVLRIQIKFKNGHG